MQTPIFTVENAQNLTAINITGIEALTTFTVDSAPLLTVSGISGFNTMTEVEDLTLKGIGETGDIDLSFAAALKTLDTTGTLATSVRIAETVLADPAFTATLAPTTEVTTDPLAPSTTAFILTNSYLTTYDFSTLPLLTLINITDSDFSAINVSTNNALITLSAYGNKISSLTLPATTTTLTTLNVGDNLLTGALNFSSYTALQEVNCDLNNITSITLSPSVQLLSCSGNPTLGGGTIDLTGITNLQNLIATTCNLTGVTVTANTALTALNVNGNLLSGINVTGNPNLTFLSCTDNVGISVLNLASNALLISLRCTGCSLMGLNVSSKPNLTYLQCDGNDINQAAADTIVAALVANGATGGTLIIKNQRLPIGTLSDATWGPLVSLGWTIS